MLIKKLLTFRKENSDSFPLLRTKRITRLVNDITLFSLLVILLSRFTVYVFIFSFERCYQEQFAIQKNFFSFLYCR